MQAIKLNHEYEIRIGLFMINYTLHASKRCPTKLVLLVVLIYDICTVNTVVYILNLKYQYVTELNVFFPTKE